MTTTVRVGIIGDYQPDFQPHRATDAAIGHAAAQLQLRAEVEWLPTPRLERDADEQLRQFDALWCAPGSPYRSMKGALRGIQDTQVPMMIAVFGYWAAGFVTAVVLGLMTPLEGVGVWIGLAVGLTVAALLLVLRWHRRERFGAASSGASPGT